MTKSTHRTICQFCHTNCGLIIHTDSKGMISSVEGDPDHPMNRGRVCSKAAAVPDIVSSKDRLRFPLLKTSSGYKRISWDSALEIGANRLGDIRAKYGPTSLLRCGGAPVSYQCRDGFLQFMGHFGSPNVTGAANLCMVPRMIAFNAVTGGARAEPDYDNTNLVLFWGTNPLASERLGSYAAYNGMRQVIPRLRKRGVRIVCIDPFHTKTVRLADDWLRIQPGSDVALGLAMIHVIIGEGLYDEAFVSAYTTGFEALAEHVQAFTPQWGAKLTGLSEKTIIDLATLYGTTKPAAIYEGNGLDMYANGVDAVRTVAMLIGLTGNLDVPGGNVFLPFASQSSLPTKVLPIEKRVGFDKFPIFAEVPFPAVKEALIREEDNRPHAMIVHHSNPVLVQANEKRTRQALEKLDFIIVDDIFPTATSEIADLILPVTSDFESFGYRAYSSVEGGFLAMARPVAAPLGESRPVFEVEYELAKRMGLEGDYPFYDTESWLQFMIKPTGVSFDRLEEEHIVYSTPPVQYRKYETRGFSTPSGKLEFYSQRFHGKGYSAIPSYSEPAGRPLSEDALSCKSPCLVGTSRRPAQFVHTKLKNSEILSRTYPEPLLWIHPEDASERGIEEGDEVAVTSSRGSLTLKAKLSEDTRSGHISIDFGWGNPTDKKANINVLVSDEYYDPISGGTPNRIFLCCVEKKIW